MQLEITDDARVLLEKRGGTMTIDFIKPTGWGKVAEVSVDTNTTNKNLAPYSRIRHPEYRILVTPVLSGMASRMRITTKGRFVKNLVVELSDERHRPVYADGDDGCWLVFRLDGKVALITGSTRGLGRAMAEAMTAQGAHVVINGRSDEAVTEVVAELSLDGQRSSGLAFDVADAASGVAAIETIVERHGAIDILVNNAGINRRAPIGEFDDGDWRDVLTVNLDAPFTLSRAAAVHMVAGGSGRIINTASIMGTVARPTIPAYVTSKAGLAGMTKALAVELGPHGVTVNAIGPGYVATEMNAALVEDPEFDAMVVAGTPVGRWGRPEEIAAAAVFLASNEASYVNGQTLVVDGGMTTALWHAAAALGGSSGADSIAQAMYAVIASGGKQEKVTEGQRVQLDLLPGDEGSEVALTPVMVVDGDDVIASGDALAAASVTGRIVGTAKGPKINGFTYKRRTNNRRRYGHRQNYSVVEITSIKKS